MLLGWTQFSVPVVFFHILFDDGDLLFRYTLNVLILFGNLMFRHTINVLIFYLSVIDHILKIITHLFLLLSGIVLLNLLAV